MGNPVLTGVSDVGDYRIHGRLREGGDGITFRASHSSSGRPAIIKLPRAEHGAAIDAFLDEIATLQLLNRAGVRGVVELLASGFVERSPWYAMAALDGEDLATHARALWAHVLRTSPFVEAPANSDVRGDTLEIGETIEPSACAREARAPERSAHEKSSPGALDGDPLQVTLRLIADIASILAEVHAQGVLHGDLSPANIMLGVNQAPTLLDFGTARSVFEPGKARERAAASGPRRATPGYAAPEVFRGQLLDSRCDIYSLGCIAYELLLGKRPFTASDSAALIQQHLLGAPDFPSPGELPDGVVQLLRRMLEKDRSRRISHAIEVAEELARWNADSRSIAAGTRSIGLFRPRLAGRAGPLSRLRQVVDDARQGQGGVVIVRGASGHGKTRLVNELGFDAERGGARVLVCRCVQAPTALDPAEPALSSGLELFEPVFERIATALASRELDLATDRDGTLALAVASVQPYSPVRLAAQELPALPPLSPAAATQRVFQGLSLLLAQLATARPLVLLLDDLQWADELSARFLVRFARDARQLPIVAIATTRDRIGLGEPDELRDASRCDVVLGPLEGSDLAEVAKDLLGSEALPEGFLDFLIGRSEGVPFFIAEYTRAALRAGWLRRESAGRWSFTLPSNAGAEAILARTIDEVLVERASALSGDASRALRLAAVLGREFDGADLARLAGDAVASRTALSELVVRELLVQPESDRFRFAHDAIREAVERSVASDERARLHRLAADVVAKKTFARELQRAARLGHHWSEAGEPARALEQLEHAALAAVRENSLSLACDLYRAAYQQCELTQEPSPSKLSQLDEDLGDVLFTLARHTEARARFRQALRGRDESAALERGRLWRKLGASCLTLHEYDQVAAALDEAEKALSHISSPDVTTIREVIEVKLRRAAHFYFSQIEGPGMDALFEELRTLVDAHGTDTQRSDYYVLASNRALLRQRFAHNPEAVRLAERAIEASQTLTPEEKATARLACGFSMLFGPVELCQSALAHLNVAATEAEAALRTTLSARVATYRTVAVLRMGDIEATRAAAARALAVAEAAQQAPYIALAHACSGWVAWRTGDPEATRQLERAREMWLRHAHPFASRWVANIPLLALALARDELERCRDYLEDLLAPGQLALPAELAALVRCAADSCREDAPRVAAATVEAALRLARELGYC
jgi:predicted negative regulator of RcsB-dependent stress response